MPRLLPFCISVETDRPVFPQVCICCGGAAEVQHKAEPPPRPRGMDGPDGALELPYCQICLGHFRRYQQGGVANMVTFNLLVWGIALPMLSGFPGVWSLAGPGFAGAYYLRSKGNPPTMKESCSTEGYACRAIWYRRSTYVFSFSSEDYAQLFRNANLAALTPS